MEIAQLIRERRSVHVFEETPVPAELILSLLETAVWVPNHRLTQPWRFVLFQGEGRERLAQAARVLNEGWQWDESKKAETGLKYYRKIMSVPTFLMVILMEDAHPMVREEDYAAASCLIHNFSLLAWEKGIGMVWETYPLLHETLFREAAGVRPGERIVGSLHVGYPAKLPKAQPRIPAADRFTIVDRA